MRDKRIAIVHTANMGAAVAARLAAIVGQHMTRDASQALPSAGKRTPDQVATRLDELRARTDLRRAMADAPVIDVDARTVDLSFSSTTEVSRWFGIEVLSHAPGAMLTERLNASAPFLWMHQWNDQRGVVVPGTVRLDGNKGRAKVKLSRTKDGEDLFLDMQDGVKPNISVGYRILDAVLQEVRDGDVEVWLITKWEPYEISSVSVPADTAVGAGRSAAKPQEETNVNAEQNSPHPQSVVTRTEPQPKDTHTMKVKNVRNAKGDLVRAEVDDAGAIVRELEVLEAAGEDAAAHIRNGSGAEQRRTRTLLDMGDKYGKLVKDASERAAKAIRDNKSPEQFQQELLDAVEQRASQPLSEQSEDAAIGLSDAEVERFSFLRAIRALTPNATRKDREAAAFEFEVSQAAARAYGKEANGILVPMEVLARAHAGTARAFGGGMQRAPMATTGNPGQALVANTTLWGSFIEMLRNRTTIMRMSTVLGGLVGTVDIPKQTGGATGYWVGEGEDAGETGIGLGQIALSAKTVAAFTELTRRLMMQSTPDAEGMVRRDLAIALGQQIDWAGYYGKGTDKQPRGLKNYDLINGFQFAAAQPTYPEIVRMETEISSDNADVDSMAYVGNAKFRGAMKTALKFANVAGTIWEPGNTVNGYRTEITNQVADGDVFFGNFADFIIGMWGGLDLTVDPYSLSKSGGLRVVVFQDVDMNLRREESICYSKP
jgi:HK97 family phage major capsid protein/HK97 family phage prohead protease